ncbi:MAG: preprotein translocase subunit YidC [Parcubacteria group bacterium Gr01-1014_30]|nr:MAG: preprotein translocase subunit YidC [Parcubacteria group bacterium Gr01-1014_30]
MEFLVNAFNLTLYQPLFNALILLYEYFPGRDFGLAVIVLTLLIKVILYPLGVQAIRAQKNLAQLQPKVEALQKKHKDDKEKLVKETLELYKKEKINPLSGFLPILIQLPILIAIYQVFWRGFGPEQMAYLYRFVPRPEQFDTTFLGALDLASPNFFLAALAGVTQFFQTKMITPTPKVGVGASPKTADFSKMMQKQMLYFLPAVTVLILWKLPSAIGLYWAATSLFTILQQHLVSRKVHA